MSRSWYETLDDAARADADALIARLHGLGCPDPEHWARRELRERAPQLSRLVLLKHLWSESIDAWSESLIWIDNLIEESKADPDAAFADVGRALKRLIAAGVDRAEIGRLARFIAYETVFSVVHAFDEGYDPQHEGQLPGWAVVERDPLGHTTSRLLTHLHEDLPKLASKDAPK